MKASRRCSWAGSEPIYVAYHDEEWGVPKADDVALYEKLVLEGFQSGLSWITILKKRENFRKAFHGFNPGRVARYGEKDIRRLLGDAGIVRHRGKIEAAISNARAVLELHKEISLSAFLWNFMDGKPAQNKVHSMSDIPGSTPLSTQIAKALKAKGFRFCGPTTVYAFMQSVGMVNDHLAACPRRSDCAQLARTFKAPAT
ncbi:MAG: DNA-3-methyladenine glycosylase I [Pseudomonadota bacterium]|nr:DNA-3-methyladenine glycosylase I [Pseudomonadota bacterium]